MARHISWTKQPQAEVKTFAKKRREWQPDGTIKVLELVDKGEDCIDRFLVKFQGKRVHFSIDFESANVIFETMEKENF